MKKIRKSFRYRIDPTDSQIESMELFANHNRGLWNILVDSGKYCLENELDLPSKIDLIYKLTDVKQLVGYEWLTEAPASTLLSTCDKYAKALWDGMKKIRRLPKFHKKGRCSHSFTYHDGNQLNFKHRHVKLPKLKGWMKIRYSRPIQGKVKTTTITKKNDRWYISFSCVVEIEDKAHPSNTEVGIDRGVVHLATCSDGVTYDLPMKHMKKLSSMISRQQKNLARKERGSNNFKKNASRIALLHERLANIRKDSLQKISTKISNNHAIISLEKLDTQKMTKSAKGTIDNPGKSVKRKSKLNAGILSQGWFMFQQMIAYKQAWANGKVTLIDPHYTSQQCSSCGFTHPLNRTSQSEFKCRTCGHADNADYNAAINIAAAGHAARDCGGGQKTPYEAVTYFRTVRA